MTEKNKKEQRVVDEEGNLLQWHPAFYAGIQIELENELDKLIFESEHNLSKKPMRIDVLIIKKLADDAIYKNIGRIFRRYNIVEYKSPTDYLSIDDFYKVYGYSCFYKSEAKRVDSIKITDITITFVSKKYPIELIEHLEKIRCFGLEKVDEGIYYITNDTLPMQLLVTSELSKEENLWLKSLTNDLDDIEIIDNPIKKEKSPSNELEDYMKDVTADLQETIAVAKRAGIADDKIILDPGVGFGKTYENNLQIINCLEQLKELGYPVLLGTSRKSVIGLTLNLPASERVEGTLVTTVFGVMKGCSFVRVHDIKENVRAIKMAEAILNSAG